jgi:tight adherence protein C
MLILKNKQKTKINARFKKNNSDNGNNSDNYEKIDAILDQFIKKIDLSVDTQIIKHKTMSIKCIRAGIRSVRTQKLCIFAQYALIIPFGLMGILGAWILDGSYVHMIVSTVIMGIIGFFFPVIRIDSMIKDRQLEIKKGFPDFVDLMLVCVEAGMTPEQTYPMICNDLKKFSVVMSEEIQVLSTEITYFLDPKTSYDNFYYRTQNEYIKAFCNVVLQSVQYGTPLAEGLRMLSLEVREAEMGEIERKAASLPSKLTVPMMAFTLPVLFAVILYPAVVLMMKNL